MRVAQTKPNCKKSIKETACLPLNSGFTAQKKFLRKELLTVLQTEILLPWKRCFRCFAENHVRFGA